VVAGAAVAGAIDEAFDAVYEAAGEGYDVPISDVVAFEEPHGRARRHWLRLMSSEDPEQVSTRGYADYDDTGHNWPVKDGYGALIERLAATQPVRLGMLVAAVREGKGGVAIETADGTLTARAAIVTCSTNVLLSGAIALDHPGVDDLIHLMTASPCGAYEKVVVAFDRNPFDADVLPYANIDAGAGSPMNFQIVPFGAPMAIGHMAGSPARELAAEGEAAMTAFGLDKLVRAFGADIPSGWSPPPSPAGPTTLTCAAAIPWRGRDGLVTAPR